MVDPRRGLASLFLASTAVVACSSSGRVDAPAGSLSGDTTNDAGRGGSSRGGSSSSSSSSSSSGSTTGTTSCEARTNEALDALAAAMKIASADLSCNVDSDCVIASNGTACSFGCPSVALNTAGAASLAQAISTINTTACAGYASDGCPNGPHSCPALPSGVACVDAACVFFPPQAWSSFALDDGPSAAGVSVPPSCAPGGGCTLWTLTPDARVVVTTNTGTHDAQLSAADFATVDAILRSTSFRAMVVGKLPTCDAPPPGRLVSFAVARASGMTGFDVTGCALVGPADNDLKRLYDTIRVY